LDGAHGGSSSSPTAAKASGADDIPDGVDKKSQRILVFRHARQEIVEFGQGGELLLGLYQEWWDTSSR
jgi:hypothetical protein